MGWGTFTYHLDRLVRGGYIELTRLGRRRYAHPRAVASYDGPRADAVLASRTARRVARILLANPGTSVSELSRLSSISARMAYYHVTAMLRAGLVVSASHTRHVGLRGTDRLVTFLEDYRALDLVDVAPER